MTTFRLDLRITARETVTINSVPAMRVAVVAENALNVPVEVFLMRQTASGAQLVTFCAASDLSNYPSSPPGVNDEWIYYRASSVEFIDDRPEKVQEFLDNMYRRRDALLDTLKELDEHPVEYVSPYEV